MSVFCFEELTLFSPKELFGLPPLRAYYPPLLIILRSLVGVLVSRLLVRELKEDFSRSYLA